MSAVIQDTRISAGERARNTPSVAARASLKGKLTALVLLAVVLLVAVKAWSIYSERQLLLEAKREQVLAVAQGAWGVANHFYEQQRSGAMTQQQAQEAARLALRGFRYGGNQGASEYIFVTDTQGNTVLNGGNPALEGSNAIARSGDKRDPALVMRERFDAMRAGGGHAFLDIMFPRPGATELSPKVNVYKEFAPWQWAIGTGVYLDDLDKILRTQLINGLAATVVLGVVLLLAGGMIARSVIRQIGGEPRMAIDIMARAARGDLTQQLPAAEPASLIGGLAAMSSEVRNLIAKVREEAATMKRDAGRIAESVGQVSTAAVQQSDATSSMAAAVQELTVSVAHISDAASQTQHNSEGVADKCRNGEVRVLSAAESMKRIAGAVGEASHKIRGLQARATQINSIAASIKEIAGQTNLLALNAAIEAARAGEQGRGFSVVADEVRKLAERTSSATVEIEEMVSAVQRETAESTDTMEHILPMVAEGTSLADEVAAALREISSSANTSLERVREVAHATKEQSSASTSIAQQVESIAQMVEATTAAMGETARSAEEMREMAERLDRMVARYHV
ncbi:Methyl-accepting chemotaxis protein 4 [Pigmentiphaga humi]|uniref:Methyl-accepting chemotaxis protein 4 n=1 Tax=Pigmentiphaga humi TaxID=2478468 RepID=A0A3P4B7A2_9BURK|nr:methyl-accepting chemotaxis protein [Pigmentiphaga humi]VCU72169.1 Methyl-accepting chemotaxis protein 4 [Pigmentiphaga humi]